MADDVTYTGYAQMGARSCATGKIASVGGSAAINVLCGFQPSCVMLFSDNGTDQIRWWTDTMDDDTIFLLNGVAAMAATGAEGIDQYDGSASTNAQGFTIAAAALTSGDTIYWVAWP